MCDLVKPKIIDSDSKVHDINSSIQALSGAMEIIKDEWKSNPDLVERILPLALDKISQLQGQLASYRQDRP